MTVDAVLGTRNRVKVLRALFCRDGLSGRQVAALAGISPSANKATVGELVEAGVVLRTNGRGKNLYELNRSHHLHRCLERLFADERRMPERLAESVGRQLRGLSTTHRLVTIGVSPTGEVRLAILPTPVADGAVEERLRRSVRFEFGLQLEGIVADPGWIPAEERIWTLPQEGQHGRRDVSNRDRALRFFGIQHDLG